MITTGWIKVYREIENHWISKDLRRLGWWIYLLYKASYEDNKVLVGSRLIELKRGQLIISLSALEKRFEASRPTVLKFLELLEQEKMVTRCVYQKVTILTICNYDDYQGVGQKEVTNMETNSLPIDLPMRYPTKEDKEEKNINNTNNTHTREGVISWDSSREQGYYNTFKGQGSALPFSKKTGKTPKEVMALLDIYMAHRELKDRGHKDYNEFISLFIWHVENNKISIPAKSETKKEPKVISGSDIYKVYG
jgi:hypothetical protein